jgi:hypothetical protein
VVPALRRGAGVTYPGPDPVGVSGPGALSQRTDIQPLRSPTGLPYGESGALTDLQRQAPLPESNPASPPPPRLSDPTTNPSQPVTAGAARGPGPGLEALAPTGVGQPPGGAVSQALARVAATDNSGTFARLLSIAQQKGL